MSDVIDLVEITLNCFKHKWLLNGKVTIWQSRHDFFFVHGCGMLAPVCVEGGFLSAQLKALELLGVTEDDH
jgi:hypothetical protein